MSQHSYVISMLIVIILCFPSMLTAMSQGINQPSEHLMTLVLTTPEYKIIQDENSKVSLEIDEFGMLLRPGYPQIPLKTYLIGLPSDATDISIRLIDVRSLKLQGLYDLSITKPVYELGTPHTIGSYQQEQQIIDFYPKEVYEFLGIGQYQDITYAIIRFTPFTYYPVEKALWYHSEITLEISYKSNTIKYDPSHLQSAKRSYASKIIENYDDLLEDRSAVPRLSNETYEYVIITTGNLEESALFLKYWRELRGLSTKIVTMNWIFDHYNGRDVQEIIRNFLIDKYQVWGIQYLLIIGSDSLIPMRDCYPDNTFHGYGGSTPTDYYYADITGDWDADGDGYFGEKGDDDPDFTAELFVGRIPYNDKESVEQICQKIIKFEQTDEEWKQQALLIGALLTIQNEDNSGYDKTDGAYLMQELRSSMLIPNQFSVTTLYEKEGLSPSWFPCDLPLTNENVIDQFSQGYGFVNWNAHGLYTAAYRLYWDWDDGDGIPEGSEMSSPAFISTYGVSLLDNEKPAIVFSCSCENAHPEYLNLGANLLWNGAVAFVGATRNAWGTVGWSEIDDGGCTTLDYLFTQYLISRDEPVGAALYKAKLDYINRYDWWDWKGYQNMYDFNLYGDPATSYDAITWFSPPDIPRTPTGGTSEVIHTDVSFETRTSDSDGHQLFYQWDFGDGTVSSWMGPYESGTPVQVSHQWIKSGFYNIRVHACDVAGMESGWSEAIQVEITTPDIKIDSIRSGIGSFRAILINNGNADAINVSWTIHMDKGFHLLSKSSGTISSLSPGKRVTIRNSFIFGFGLPVITIEYQTEKLEKESESTTALIIGPFILI